MSMFMHIFIPMLYLAGLFLAVLLILGLLMLLRNKVDNQELTNSRMSIEIDLIHTLRERELVALARDNLKLQHMQSATARMDDLFNTDAYSQAGYEVQSESHTDKGEPVLGPLTRQRDPEVPNPKHTNTVFQGGDQFGRMMHGMQNDPNAVHPAGMENAFKPVPKPETQWELKDKNIDESRYTPPQGPEPEPVPFATSCEPRSYTVGQAMPTGANELRKGRTLDDELAHEDELSDRR